MGPAAAASWSEQPLAGLGTTVERKERKEVVLDRFERLAVLRARSVPGEGFQVLTSPVSLVLLELVLRINEMEFLEAGIATDLGQDGSGGDGDGKRITMDDGAIRDGEFLSVTWPVQGHCVREDVIGRGSESAQRSDHGLPRSFIDVQGIYFRCFESDDLESDRVFVDFCCEAGAFLRGEFLRIIEARDGPDGIEDYRGRIERPEKRPASRLIATGDETPPLPGGLRLEAPCADELSRLVGSRHQ